MINQVIFSNARYCDTGPHDGMFRLAVMGTVYLTAAEYAAYLGKGELEVVLKSPEAE